MPWSSRVKTEMAESWLPWSSSLPRSYLKLLSPQLSSRRLRQPRRRACAQGRRVGGGGDRDVDVLRQVGGDAVEPVDPHGAYRAGAGLVLAVHQVVDDQRPARAAEQLDLGEPELVAAGEVVGRFIGQVGLSHRAG
jgi:hypothetical protein